MFDSEQSRGGRRSRKKRVKKGSAVPKRLMPLLDPSCPWGCTCTFPGSMLAGEGDERDIYRRWTNRVHVPTLDFLKVAVALLPLFTPVHVRFHPRLPLL